MPTTYFVPRQKYSAYHSLGVGYNVTPRNTSCLTPMMVLVTGLEAQNRELLDEG